MICDNRATFHSCPDWPDVYCEIDDNQHDWIEIVCNGIGHD